MFLKEKFNYWDHRVFLSSISFLFTIIAAQFKCYHMRKTYAMLLSALILFAGSCKKDDSNPEKAENLISGKWQMTESRLTVYENGQLKRNNENVTPDPPNTLEFKSNGKGTSMVPGDPYSYTFEYTIGDTAVTVYNVTAYKDGKVIQENSPGSVFPTKELSGDKWSVVDDATYTLVVRQIHL